MYQPMLFLHWKQIRFGLIPFLLAAYALPLLAVQGLGGGGGLGDAAYRAAVSYNPWAPFFPALAAATGVTLALSAWTWDHRLGHVYALSLPVPRWQYALLKMGAGAVLLLLPTLAFWGGAMVATRSVDLPLGLQAYPTALTLRFFLAALVAYAFIFALAAGTIRTTVALITGLALLVVLSEPLTALLANFDPSWQSTSLVEWLGTRLVETPGPFRIFAGDWTLIDV